MTNEELVYLHKQGDNEALEKLLEQNKGIVNKIVNKFYTQGINSIDREDLVQEGYIGLITAANKYDFDNEKKAQFITYAVNWIYQKINRFVKKRNTNDEVSLNTPNGEDGSIELMDCIEGVDYSIENIEEQIYNRQLRKELEDLMNKYNTLKERDILKLHYGWDNSTCMTLEEIGEIFNITGQQIRQSEVTAMRKIRQTPWGRKKSIELFKEKLLKSEYNSSPGVIDKINFASRYLN